MLTLLYIHISLALIILTRWFYIQYIYIYMAWLIYSYTPGIPTAKPAS